eukprot:3298417-Rhodomonas_salina.3
MSSDFESTQCWCNAAAATAAATHRSQLLLATCQLAVRCRVLIACFCPQISPYALADIGIGISIGVSVLGAAW